MRSIIYFNQNNYANVPYPSPTLPKATVKSGGCGAVSASMIVSNLTHQTVDPKAMAAFAIKKGARVDGGTDMNVLANALSKDYGLPFTTTNDEDTLVAHLKSGGMAVANVGGNRSGYTGVFSDGGHFIVVAGLNASGEAIVLDPGYYWGKFTKMGRAGKVTVHGNQCFCKISVLAADTSNRSPSYWLFSRKEVDEVPEWMQKLMNEAIDLELIAKDKHNPNDTATKWFVLAIALNLYKIIKRR